MGDFKILQMRLWADVLERLGGVEAVFTPMTGEPTNIKVMFAETMQMQPEGQTQTWVQEKSIAYSVADLPREAIVGETFTIDGTIYEVCAIAENDGYVIKVIVHEL
jgi:hypothetical protein